MSDVILVCGEPLEKYRTGWQENAPQAVDDLCNAVENLTARVRELEAGLETVKKIADETFDEWDRDNDMRVGKILKALAGHLPKYRADIDALHRLTPTDTKKEN